MSGWGPGTHWVTSRSDLSNLVLKLICLEFTNKKLMLELFEHHVDLMFAPVSCEGHRLLNYRLIGQILVRISVMPRAHSLEVFESIRM